MKSWLKGGLISVVVFLFIIFIVPLIINLIFCNNLLNNNLICVKVPELILDMWSVLDFISWPICMGFCNVEQSKFQIFTTIPSFFLIGAAIGYIISGLKGKKKK